MSSTNVSPRLNSLIPVYALTFVLAACSILYELLIAQTISTLWGNTVEWYSITIGLYLCALGVGAFQAPRLFENKNLWLLLFKIELLLSLAGALAPLLVRFGYSLGVYGFMLNRPMLAALSALPAALAAIIAVGYLSGIELPLLLEIGKNSRKDGESPVNRILAADYIGSLAGAVLFGVCLVPLTGTTTIAMLVACLNAASALYIIGRHGKDFPARIFRTALCAAALCVLVCGVLLGSRLTQYFLKRQYYSKHFPDTVSEFVFGMNNLPDIEHYLSAYQRIDIVKIERSYSDYLHDAYSEKFKRHPEYPRDLALFINGTPQFYSNWDEVYHEYFAHVPVLHSARIPKKVLILGGGDGLLLRELNKYKAIESITLVDIDPVMLELAKSHPALSAMNGSAFDDPRVRAIADDAFHYIKSTDAAFDAVYLDFPYPEDFDVSRLYSREFYTLVRKRLSKHGFVAMNAAGIDDLGFPDSKGRQAIESGNLWPVYYASLRKAGFNFVEPYLANLEIANQKAVDIALANEFAGITTNLKPWEKSHRMLQFLKTHVMTLQYGFIMAYDSELPQGRRIAYPNIELNVLNKQRFFNTFKTPFNNKTPIDESQVNSIIRPIAARAPFFSLKVPEMRTR